MKTVDLTPLKANDSEYEDLANMIADRYECQWDDDVHESYGQYVKQAQENSRAIHVIRCKSETLLEEIEGLNVDEMVQKTEALCEESEAV